MPPIPRIYLDACALNRLTDNPAQLRIAEEADAIMEFFRLISTGNLIWIASSVLEIELRKNPDMRRREDALAMLHYANELYVPDSSELQGRGPYNGLATGISTPCISQPRNSRKRTFW